ncbi:hypotheticalsprotein [Cercospora beticola]|uniref:Hypotheticalsprotein n=1 Tax=Cercospora beticola TaxID=122368 RepID=A0A2G5HDX6_CERBT|nr:hypotheticalsprotein [Cercospora beticola]PIA90750.1 hypotheticalsprotein [Cercospora beticola]WPB08311.1 hypothetical protein RHO25_012977 [Cercospora beticola]CAK1367806.1 unnamed protein product [Cercospora beticola]
MTRNIAIREPAGPKTQRVDADLLIPGRGEPVKHAALIYEAIEKASGKGKILFAGNKDDVPSKYANVKASLHVPVLMPGMWDCHVHLIGQKDLNLEQIALMSSSTAGFRIARDAVATLNAGFTSVREVGGYGIDIKSSIEEGWIPGPHIYSAGSILSQTAGHGDLHTMPLELMHHRMTDGFPLALADGIDEAIKQTRKQIRRGASVIKVCATGGVLSRIDSPKAAQFTNAELEAIVGEATRTNMIVAAHAHGTEGILAALHAGVKTIEHGSYLTEEAIELMLEKEAILVPTRYVQQYGIEHAEQMAPESYQKMAETVNANKESYRKAIKAGVRIALGTDLGISSHGAKFNHGTNGKEFYYAVEAGLTPLQAIEAGTATAPATLGPQAPKSGQLREGYDADFIALVKNPLDDIEVLARAEEVKFVWKGGRLVKRDGEKIGII